MEGSKQNAGLKASVQKLGSHLSSMVMPNIGSFIAWGLIAAIFIPTGWYPNESLNEMTGPMQTYLLPLLIGYTGGSMVYGQRGAVVGAIATIGVIVGSDVPMFIGAMMMGPLGGWVIKKFDENFQEKIPSGFEMLVNNFSSGISGFILAILGFIVIGPIVTGLTNGLAAGVAAIVERNLLPAANILIEPAKILFLNNAINHGIFTPLGARQVAEVGKSVLFLLEANPGPGLGVLLAYSLFGKGSAKSSSYGAMIIHFLGGIHEIYFPYVMMKPAMFLAVIAGGVSGTFMFQMLGAGLTGAASPGSIIAILGMTARGSYLAVISGVVVGALVSFLVASVILKADKSTEDDFEAQQRATAAAKQASKGEGTTEVSEADDVPSVDDIERIIFACDAGMGSSAMGASLLRKKVKAEGIDLPVTNSAIGNLQDDAKTLVITQEELTTRARKQAPSSIHVSVENFLDGDRYDDILKEMLGQDDSNKDEVAEATKAKATEDAIDYAKVKDIAFVYSGKVGASTMGASLLRNQLAKADKTFNVYAVDVNDLSDSDDLLVIVEGDLKEAVEDKVSKGQVTEIENYLDEATYKNLTDKL